MSYQNDLSFFECLLKNFSLPFTYIYPEKMVPPNIDWGIRSFLHLDDNYQFFFQQAPSQLEECKIYQIRDYFSCNYFFLKIPDTSEPMVLVAGPYLQQSIPRQTLLSYAKRYKISSQLFQDFEKLYSDLPLFPDDFVLYTLFNTLGEKLWGGLDHFTFEAKEYTMSESLIAEQISAYFSDSDNVILSAQILEERYQKENLILQAVSQGLSNKAELLLSNTGYFDVEQRHPDPIRNIKNLTIVLNTLLRKATELGDVHPLHIDALSSEFARQIEQLTSAESAKKLHKIMIHKYCLLVKNHSLKNYSLLIRKVLTRIDSDLTADLSLKTQASLLNVNPSYLSTLFKKETGSTLTEYANRKRMEHGLLLLNSTNLQIQTIAQHCGISDVNYFTKTFKKHYGKTPKEYRESIRP